MAGGAKEIRAGRAFVELTLRDRLARGLAAAASRIRAFGVGVTVLGTTLVGAGASILGTLAAITKGFAETGDSLRDMAIRTGFAVETLSELSFALEQNGSSLEEFENGVRRMQRTISDAGRGLTTAQEALDALGLTLGQIDKLTPEEQFLAIADRLAQIEDPTKRAAVAMEVFGRSGTKMIPLLADGAAGIAALREEARALGLTISRADADLADNFNDTLNILYRVLKQNVFVIGSALAPTLIDVAKRVTGVVTQISAWIKANRGLAVSVLKLGAATVAVGAGLVALGTVIVGVAAVISAIAPAVTVAVAAFGVLAKTVLLPVIAAKTIVAAFLAIGPALAGVATGATTLVGAVAAALTGIITPAGLATAAIAAIGYAILAVGGYFLVTSGVIGKALDFLRGAFSSLIQTAREAVDGIADALAAGDVILAAKILWAGIKLEFKKGAAAAIETWVAFKANFLQVSSDVFYGAARFAADASFAILDAFANAKAKLASVWADIANRASEAWNLIVYLARQAAVNVAAAFDDRINVDVAMQEVDRRFIEDQKKAQRDLARDQFEAEEARKRRVMALEGQRRALQNALNAAQERADRERAARLQREFEAASAELDDARRQFDTLRAQAARQREERGDDEAGSGLASRLSDLLDGLDDQIAGLSTKAKASGTFSASTAQSVAEGGPQMSKVEKNTAKANEYLRSINRSLQNAGGIPLG